MIRIMCPRFVGLLLVFALPYVCLGRTPQAAREMKPEDIAWLSHAAKSSRDLRERMFMISELAKVRGSAGDVDDVRRMFSSARFRDEMIEDCDMATQMRGSAATNAVAYYDRNLVLCALNLALPLNTNIVAVVETFWKDQTGAQSLTNITESVLKSMTHVYFDTPVKAIPGSKISVEDIRIDDNGFGEASVEFVGSSVGFLFLSRTIGSRVVWLPADIYIGAPNISWPPSIHPRSDQTENTKAIGEGGVKSSHFTNRAMTVPSD